MSTPRYGSESERRRDTAAAHFTAVEGIIAHMRRHLAEPLDLNTLSRVAAMSKFHFVRTFEEVTGTTPHHFLSCLRIEQAKQLLRDTAIDVTEICMTVGYSSLGSFSSAFADLVGLSPSTYRRLPGTVDVSRLLPRVAAFLDLQKQREGPSFTGWIEKPPALDRGFIFVGAFIDGVPQRVPECGTVILDPGEYHIPRPTALSFHLMAALVPFRPAVSPMGGFLRVECVASIRVLANDLQGDRLPPLTLRPPKATDPPLLVELSTLLS